MRTVKAERGGIRLNTTSANTVRSYFETFYSQRVFHPIGGDSEPEALQSQIQSWKAAGKTVVFTSGVYDLFHANHRTFLLHTKLAAAQYCWENPKGQPSSVTLDDWLSISEESKDRYTKELLAKDAIKLIVSVDGNMAVAKRKSHKVDKGSMPRPLFDWTTRVRDVLSLGFEVSPGDFRPVVDAVTIHDDISPDLKDTPHSGIMEIASFIKPDVWAIYQESQDIIDALNSTHSFMFDNGMSAFVLSNEVYYEDPLLEGPLHTSKIAQRIGRTLIDQE